MKARNNLEKAPIHLFKRAMGAIEGPERRRCLSPAADTGRDCTLWPPVTSRDFRGRNAWILSRLEVMV